VSNREHNHIWAYPLLSLLVPIASTHLFPKGDLWVAIPVWLCFLFPTFVAIGTLIRIHFLKKKVELYGYGSGIQVAQWISWLLILITPVLFYIGAWTAFVMSGGKC
jgi:hypothetical protein